MKKVGILIRSLFKNRTTSIITLIGFSVSISMTLLLVAFLINEFSVDKDYPNLNRIYRVFANETTASVREDFREYFLENYPSIEDACRYNNYGTIITYNDKPFNGNMIVTDSSFFKIFSTKFEFGNIGTSFKSPNDIILTESFAKRVFGNEDPIGKTIIAEYKTPLVVSGVVEDFPQNSSIQGDFFTNTATIIKYEGSSDGQGNSVNFFRLFILVRNNTDIPLLEELLTRDVTSITYKVGYAIEQINLIPFAKSYFMQGINRSMTRHANLKLLRILLVITSAIVLLAIFNYINLTTASHTDRFKEIAIKKSVGASRWQIFVQFIDESVLICFLSFLLALFLSTLWIPFFERFLGHTINLSVLYKPVNIIWLLLGISIISIISGTYPALTISGLKPINIIMKRGMGRLNSLNLRAILNILQSSVSVILIIALIVISKQIDYVRTKNYGFDTDKLIRVDVHWRLADRLSAIRNKLTEESTIKNVCFSHGTPGSIYATSSWDFNGNEGIINRLTVDTAFFKIFDIPVIMGRLPLQSDFNKVCYINETAYKKTGWDTFEGKKYRNMEIIGIVSDFHFADMYNQIAPLVISISSGMGVSHMTLRIEPGNIPRTINVLAETWKEICPGYEMKYQFYDEWLDSMYKGEERLAAAIRLFTVLAIMISCLGILGLAEFSIKKRVKEIGLRKVSGATISEIMILLNMDFIKWIMISFIISIPLSVYIMNSWLQSFAYKTDLSWWIFLLAGALALTISLLTISLQSWLAATRNPVEALRYE